uniref:Uncharacterized protein n=1 Tax=Zea mays TaxID=4577 RepID=C4J213_MAIZE|nr:unknown [Zea mays]
MVGIIPAWWTLLHPRDISPLRRNLNLSTMQFRFIQVQSFLDSFLFQKFNISKTFWLPKLVSQDCHPVDSSTSLEMLLHFFWGASIINMSYLCTTQVISVDQQLPTTSDVSMPVPVKKCHPECTQQLCVDFFCFAREVI